MIDATLLLPSLDFGYSEIIAAVFRSCGVKALALPAPDGETRAVCERLTSGDECFPFQIIAGDVVRYLRKNQDIVGNVAVFLPVISCSCRYSCYAVNLEELLAAAGFEGVNVIAPADPEEYGGLTSLWATGLFTASRALSVGDALQRLLLRNRPYETSAGETDGVHGRLLQEFCSLVEVTPPEDQASAFSTFLQNAGASFSEIPKTGGRRPVISIVGEFFGRYCPLLNNNLVRALERFGAEVRMTGVAAEAGIYFRHFGISADEQHDSFAETVAAFCSDSGLETDLRVEELISVAVPYMQNPQGIPALRLGQIHKAAGAGLAGLISVNFFPCMISTASGVFYPRLAEDLAGFPMDHYFFKGGDRDISPRVEKFMKKLGKSGKERGDGEGRSGRPGRGGRR